MLFLLLAIASSSAISLLLRAGSRHVKNNMAMFATNYFVCLLCSFFFLFDHLRPASLGGVPFCFGLGLVSGFFYLFTFVLNQVNIGKNGVVLSAVFMKLGVLVPTLMAVVVYKESLRGLKAVGFGLALAAIVIINSGAKASAQGNSDAAPETSLKGSVPFLSGSGLLLVGLLLSSGFTDSLANIYEQNGAAALKDHYLFFTFLFAAVFSLLIGKLKKQHFTLTDAFWGVLIGVPNYFSVRFLLAALHELPATLCYPVCNAGTIVVISAVGVLLFKEKLTGRGKVGLGLILIALILINLG